MKARDVIDRHDALYALDCIEMSSEETWQDYYRKALGAISALPSVPDWIPCVIRLPEKGEEVLICTRKKKRRVAIYQGQNAKNHAVWKCDAEWEFGFYWDTEVIAWMPLPKSYEE